MRLYRSLEEIEPAERGPRAVAIGVFDGVHRGHQEIVGRAVALATAGGGISTVLTFDPHPDSVVRPGPRPPALVTLRQKLELLEAAGVDEVAVVPFDPAFAGLGPEEFCRDLVAGRFGAGWVAVGANFRFGAKGAGTIRDLEAFGSRFDFAVTAVELLRERGEVISSTRIRRLLEQGAVEDAARLLGRDHSVEGYVVAGAGRGRDLGVPTANLAVEGGVAVPAPAVYVTSTLVSGRPLPSVTSIGTNPTFESDGRVHVETHLLDFQGGLYGEWLRVVFHRRLRGQRRYAGPEELVTQIRADIEAAEAYFAQEGPRASGRPGPMVT